MVAQQLDTRSIKFDDSFHVRVDFRCAESREQDVGETKTRALRKQKKQIRKKSERETDLVGKFRRFTTTTAEKSP